MRHTVRTKARHTQLLGIACLLAWSGLGCGSQPEEVLSSPDTYSNSIKSAVYEFCAIARQRGIKGSKPEISTALERIEGYDEKHLGEHAATYQQIVEKLTSLKSQMTGTMTNADLKKTIDEIEALANRLPGEAKKKPPPRSDDDC